MSFAFTPSQKRAVEDREGAVLVSAAAGSGKTRVLTERLIAYVTDPERPVDIDRFLVITYTRAAAAELRDRILSTLNERLGADPEDRRLRRQQTLCCRAHIGTIHSFCADLIRENCHVLGLPPRFAVLEEDRAETLRAGVLSRLLDAAYETLGTDPAFRLLADTVGAGTDDARLEDAVLQLHAKLRSQPFPERWAEAQKSSFAAGGVTDALDTPWGKELLRGAERRADHWIGRLEAAAAEMNAADAAISKAYGSRFAEVAEQLRELRRALSLGWDAARAASSIVFPRLGALRSYPNEALQQRMKAVWDGCKKACGELQNIFAESSETLLADLRTMAPAMGRLLDLTLELDRAFSAEKLRRAALDYSDLEHYAARLLLDPETGERTHLARETAERFVEIMVDEYQDVSPIQEDIFKALSREERNLFLVGDVKQSIYRFRLAEPRLFLRRYEDYVPAERAENGEPRRIDLQENFRSRRAILNCANHCFSALMSEELGELDYDEAAALHYGAPDYPEGTDVPPELCLIAPETGDAEAEPPEASETEARWVARRIRQMMAERVQVFEKGGHRDCRWGDFVLLLRSPGGKGRLFHRVLAEEGIPVSSRQGDGFFTGLEITTAVNLLSLTDNPHADVPLISALRSPVFGFTPDELSLIRAGRKDRSFYSAVCDAAEAGDAHCRQFLELLNTWRALAPDLALDRLLWRICNDTDLFAVCAAMPDGEGRRRNLMRLFEYAAGFTRQGYRGVFRFVRWLQALAESGAEPELAEEADSVRILSVHKSKGLEFPFVFLCDLSRNFNRRDRTERVLMHTKLGLGPKMVDRDNGVEYPTLARRAIAARMERENLSEELRVLYVAMTRARERLILTASVKDPAAAVAKYSDIPSGPIPPEVLRTASNPAAWLLRAALLPGAPLTLRCVTAAEETAPEAAAPERDPAESEAAYAALAAHLSYAYPWPKASSLPAKLTATELKREAEAEEDGEAAVLLPRDRAAASRRFRPARPGEARRLSAAERGTATHSFLQNVDLPKTGDRAALRSELDRLTAAGLLRPEEADAVDLEAVRRLFASDLGRAMVRSSTLRREFRFTLLRPASDYFEGAAPEDRLLLQGIVDCFFVENGAVTVVDYKTDRVTAAEAPVRAERHRPQLETYARALERILGLPVKRCVLWFLHCAAEVELSVPSK